MTQMRKVIYFDEAAEFDRLEAGTEKTRLALYRLENPYNLSEETAKSYTVYLDKSAAGTVEGIIEENRLSLLPLLVKYSVIKKSNVAKYVSFAQQARKTDALAYLLNASNLLRAGKGASAPKYKEGVYENTPQSLPGENVRVGDIVWLGTNPIPWQVLEKKDKQAVIISKYILDCRPFHDTYTSVTWERCSLRKWLNGSFCAENFSRREQNIMRKVSTEGEDTLSRSEGEGDRLFLLSRKETERYFKNADSKKALISLKAKNKVMWTSFDKYGHWWLRSPGTQEVGAVYVRTDGEIFPHGGTILSNSFDKYFEHYGVRPAMRIRLG